MNRFKFLIVCVFLPVFSFSSVASGDQGKSLKQVLKLNKGNILSPKDLDGNYELPQEQDFPVTWKEVHSGMFNMEITYTYDYVKTEENKTYIVMTSAVDDPKVNIYLENGKEYTDRGYGYKLIGHQNCLLVIGDCKYEYLGNLKTAKTKFKNGVWITVTHNSKIESIYEKNGLLLYRRHVVNNGNESTVYRID